MSAGRGWRPPAAVLVLLLLAMGAACAKKLPPPGGKPDQEPPLVAASRPESGAVRVPRTGAIELEFTESMNERLTATAILVTPYARASKLEWDGGKVFRYRLADTLRADQTYHVLVGRGARDVRGNPLPTGMDILFTTGDALATGTIAGRVVARGHGAAGIYVWAYREDLAHAPDSTARDFDALSVAGPDGGFALRGLATPSVWRLFAFHDANGTQTFEPGTDHLTRQDTTYALTLESPLVDSARVVSIDPTAGGVARGRVVDADSAAREPLRLVVEEVLEASREGRRWENPVVSGPFQIALDPGRYRLWLYRDRNRNAKLDDGEPKSDLLEIAVESGQELTDLELVAPRLPADAPGGP